MLIPLVAVHYTRDLGMAAATVGLVLGIRMLAQQGLTLFGGALADRRGYKAPIVAGLLLRSLGFGAFALADTFLTLLLAVLVAALGGALFESSGKAALAALVSSRERARAFSLYTLASNAGMTLGPLAGVMLVGINFGLLSMVAAGVFLLAGLQTLVFLPSIPPRQAARSLGSGLATVWHDRRFVVFTAIMAGYWLITIGLFITLPLYLQTVFGNQSSLGLLYAVNSGVALILQYPLVRFMSARLSPVKVVAAGVGTVAAALAMMPLAPGLPAMIVAIGLYAAGRAMVEPTFNSYVSEVAPASGMGSYFGFSALALALGGGFSNLAAGALHDLAVTLGLPALPWLVMAVVGIGVSALLVLFEGWGHRAKVMHPFIVRPSALP